MLPQPVEAGPAAPRGHESPLPVTFEVERPAARVDVAGQAPVAMVTPDEAAAATERILRGNGLRDACARPSI